METAEVKTKTKWGIDFSHSEIAFKVKHLMIANIKGFFKEFDANIYTTGEDFMTSQIDFWLNPASIHTNDVQRDEHLKGTDFFDVLNHKQINFVGNTFVKMDQIGHYELYGELTMKNITNKIKLNIEFGGVVKDPWGNEKAGFTINGIINRKDWGLNWNTVMETGGFLVSDQVAINCELELIKKS